MLGEGQPQTVIAKKLKLSKQGINYYAGKAVSQGLIKAQVSHKIIENRESEEVTKGGTTIFYLTPLGQMFLTGSERGVLPEPCTIEDYALKFPLVADNSKLNWKPCGQPMNWAKVNVRFAGVSVEKNMGLHPSVIIRAGQLAGFDFESLFVQAGGIITAIRLILEDKGVVLGDVGVPVRDPNVKTFTPEALVLHEKYGNIETESGIIDDSPPAKIPHEERSRQQQRNYLAMADRVAKIELMIINIKEEQARIVATQEHLVAIAQEQTTLLKNQQEFWNQLFNQNQQSREQLQEHPKLPEGLSSVYQ